jgi:hypothetical protein
MKEIPWLIMLKPPDPTNFLACREHYQCCKYRLLRTEEQLFKIFGVSKLADLQMAMDKEQANKYGKHRDIMRLYALQHDEFGAADEAFEAARMLQRKRIEHETLVGANK